MVRLLPDAGFDPAGIDEFNRQSDFEYERIRDFIILHYKATERDRDDTPFWRHCRDMEVPATLRRKMDLFAANGRVFREDDELFTEESWIQVFLGQGIVPRGHDPLVGVQSDEQIALFLANIESVIGKCVNVMPSHAEFVARACQAPAPVRSPVPSFRSRTRSNAMTTDAQPASVLRILCRTTAAVALLALTPAAEAMAEVMPTKASAPLAPRVGDPAWARADALVTQMTLDEKIRYLHGALPADDQDGLGRHDPLGRLCARRAAPEDPDPAPDRRQSWGRQSGRAAQGRRRHGPAVWPGPGVHLRAATGLSRRRHDRRRRRGPRPSTSCWPAA
jgi:hypothetical protein